ncbi:MAG: beta-propeller domain-containing protein [Acidimicrobiales bacterium]
MKKRLFARLAPACLAGVLAATACTDTSSTNEGGLDLDRRDTTDLSSDDIILTSGLRTVDSCDALLERIKDEAVERVGPYGFQNDPYPFFLEEGVAMEDEESSADAAESAPSATTAARSGNLAAADGDDSGGLDSGADQAEGEFSETNNQEQGVDEADLVKTDGDRIVIVSGSQLRVIDTTGAIPELVKTIDLPDETWGGQLFLRGDRALLMTTGWTERPFVERSVPVDWYPGSPIGRLIEVDLDTGRVERTFEFEGNYLSAREIDGSMRIVLTAAADRFSFVFPSNEGAVDSAEQANRDLIERSTIDQWIPTYRITEGGETVDEGPIVDCDRVHLPTEFAGFGSLVMLTASLDDGFAVSDSLSVFTDAQTMYASPELVAVATPSWPTLEDGELVQQPDYETAIHTFDITDPDRADYVASGSVRGHLLNQYSLSEYDGYLRVATTDGDPWWGGFEESESFVTVLDEQDGALRKVGQVGGLGRGEQIFAVRFLGDLGYVVTFEQVDPLYVVDLRSPTDPRVLGELKIPGFSSYLHPVGDDHLLGIGTDGDDTGRTFGAAVSLFDVSDLTDPQLVDKVNFDDSIDLSQGSTYSPISNDAKAFTYWDDVAVVPVSWWDYDPNRGSEENGSEVVLVRVDVGSNRLTEIGRVSMPQTRECESGVYVEEPFPEPLEEGDGEEEPSAGSGDAEASFVDPEPAEEQPVADIEPAPSPRDDEWCWSWAPEVQRTVVVDENLYSISDGGVMVNSFDGLDNVTWIPFNQR